MQVRIKYALDRLVAAGALVVLWPLYATIALIILIDDGRPIFFRQQRPGLGGQVFSVWKFRTMVSNADDFLDEDGRPTRDRITRSGRVLRQTSLDELPNLFNILTGEMSFIGPRPALVEHLNRYTTQQMRRFRMKPGITGLAQVNGRNELPWSDRLSYDNQYIDEYSLRQDINILWRTIGVVLRQEGISHDRNPERADDLG